MALQLHQRAYEYAQKLIRNQCVSRPMAPPSIGSVALSGKRPERKALSVPEQMEPTRTLMLT